MVRAAMIHLADIDRVWPAIAHHIEAYASRYGNMTTGQYYVQCRTGNGFLFIADDLSAAAIVVLDEQRGQSVARITAMGGNGADWASLLGQIDDWAKANHAVKTVFSGRKGWQRKLGLKPVWYTYEVNNG